MIGGEGFDGLAEEALEKLAADADAGPAGGAQVLAVAEAAEGGDAGGTVAVDVVEGDAGIEAGLAGRWWMSFGEGGGEVEGLFGEGPGEFFEAGGRGAELVGTIG